MHLRNTLQRVLTLLLALLFALSPSSVLSQGGSEGTEAEAAGTESSLLSEILLEIEQLGWSEEHRAALEALADGQGFDEVSASDPRAVAETVGLAMQYVDRSGVELSGEQASVMALELARNAAAMQAVGLETRDIARATLAGTRSTVRAIEAGPTNGGQPGGPSEAPEERGPGAAPAVQEATRRAVGQAMRDQVGAAAAEQARERRNLGRGNAPGAPPGRGPELSPPGRTGVPPGWADGSPGGGNGPPVDPGPPGGDTGPPGGDTGPPDQPGSSDDAPGAPNNSESNAPDTPGSPNASNPPNTPQTTEPQR
jgi:hypothetical protein